jgi:hypothetical protein
MSDYQAFLASKRIQTQASGIEVDPTGIHPMLFPFQRDLVIWALRKGRAAVFADCGLGKTFVQLECRSADRARGSQDRSARPLHPRRI